MFDRYGPAPPGARWVDVRLIGEPGDVEEWARLLHEGTEIAHDSGSKPVNSQPGVVRRYLRARTTPGPAS